MFRNVPMYRNSCSVRWWNKWVNCSLPTGENPSNAEKNRPAGGFIQTGRMDAQTHRKADVKVEIVI